MPPTRSHIRATAEVYLARHPHEREALAGLPALLDGTGDPIDIDVHDIDANPAKDEPSHRHFDFRFAFYLANEHPPLLALQDEEVCGAQWLPFEDVRSPTLRAKLLDAEGAGLTGRPEPGFVNRTSGA
ncbi:hypothetical protein ACWFR5_17285 [Streptomyces sp. NPDC055092]